MSDGRSELAHPVRLDRIGSAAMTIVIEPGHDTRRALALRFGLEEVRSLRSELSVRRRPETGWIEVAGSLVADVVQTCVATTEPVPAQVRTDILELFDDSPDATDGEILLDPTADTPEPVEGDVLDVGEVVAQTFGLALDPYPRAPDAAVVDSASDSGDPGRASPFAGLAALKGLPGPKG